MEGYEPYTKGDGVFAERLYTPRVTVRRCRDESVEASLDGLTTKLFDAHDLVRLANTNGGAEHLMRGLIGERFLNLILEQYLRAQGDYHVLPKGKPARKGYVVEFSDDYVLRFKGEDQRIILLGRETEPQLYEQERFGLTPLAEIDGIGFLSGERKQVFIGEASTAKEFVINSWERRETDIMDRLFRPIQQLYNDHDLVYLVMAYERNLWSAQEEGYRLREAPRKVHARLADEGIRSLFVPLPETEPSLQELAEQFAQSIPLARAILRSL